MVIWAVRAKWNELDPISEVVRRIQANIFEKMPTTSFHPSFLHQTAGAEGIGGTYQSKLVDDFVDELLGEVGHHGSWRHSTCMTRLMECFG